MEDSLILAAKEPSGLPMEEEVVMKKGRVWVLMLLVVALPALAFGQKGGNAWDELHGLTGGTRIKVEEVNGTRLQGIFLGVTDDSISLWVKDRQVDIRRPDVRQVKGPGLGSRVGSSLFLLGASALMVGVAAHDSGVHDSAAAADAISKAAKGLAAIPAEIQAHPRYEAPKPKPGASAPGTTNPKVKQPPSSSPSSLRSKDSVPPNPQVRN
jgi:hypothetical protein